MIISHEHRFIFFAVPKTATHAIRQVLRNSLGFGDWEQQVLFSEQYLPIPQIRAIGHGHVSVQQIKPELSGYQWSNYYKFAFVRNPYDRFVSTCFFLNRVTPDFELSAKEFMKHAIRRPRFQQRILVTPQTRLLTESNGELAVDYLGRYETLQESLDFICGEIGIPSAPLASKNASKHASYQDYYDDELRELVRDFYRADLRLLSYDF